MVEFVVKGDTHGSKAIYPHFMMLPVTQRMKDALCQETPESAFPSRRVSTFHLDAFVDDHRRTGC